MIRLLFRALPIGILIYGIYYSSDKAKDLLRSSKDMVLQVKTQMAMSNMAKQLRPMAAAGNPLPRDLQAYMRENMKGGGADAGLDSWQTPYQIARTRSGVFLASCGPDKKCATKDDIRTPLADTAAIEPELSAAKRRAAATSRASAKVEPHPLAPGPADPAGKKTAELRAPSPGPIYKWVDKKGGLHFTQTPPANRRYEVVEGGR